MNPADAQGFLTIEGITVTGILLMAVILIGIEYKKTKTLLRESEANRLADKDKYIDKLEDVRKETHDLLTKLKESFIYDNRR